MPNKNDVVTAVTLSGEFVGKFESHDDSVLVLNDPRLVTNTQEGASFIPAVSMTGIQNPDRVELNSSLVVMVIQTADEVEKVYRQVTSGIIT